MCTGTFQPKGTSACLQRWLSINPVGVSWMTCLLPVLSLQAHNGDGDREGCSWLFWLQEYAFVPYLQSFGGEGLCFSASLTSKLAMFLTLANKT